MNKEKLALKKFPRISDEFLPLYHSIRKDYFENSLKKGKSSIYFGVWTRVFVQNHENILYSFLSKEEKELYQQFRLAKRKEEFLGARTLLKLSLLKLFQTRPWQKIIPHQYEENEKYSYSYSKLSFQDLTIRKTPQGKPELMIQNQKNSQIHLSISHSSSIIFTAMDTENEVGIDVEDLEENSERLLKIKKKYLQKNEEERFLQPFLQELTVKEDLLFLYYNSSIPTRNHNNTKDKAHNRKETIPKNKLNKLNKLQTELSKLLKKKEIKKEELKADSLFYPMMWCSKESLIKLLGASRTQLNQRIELSHIKIKTKNKQESQKKKQEKFDGEKFDGKIFDKEEFDENKFHEKKIDRKTLASMPQFHPIFYSIFYWKDKQYTTKKIPVPNQEDNSENNFIEKKKQTSKKDSPLYPTQETQWVISKNYPYKNLIFSIAQKHRKNTKETTYPKNRIFRL